MKRLPDKSVDFNCTDIPYSAVNREGNGLRNLDKDRADVLTFDLEAFLDEVYRTTKNSIVIFCGKEQFSTIYEYFANKKRHRETNSVAKIQSLTNEWTIYIFKWC